MQKNKPFFSIIIPTYNRANLILETLDSVFDQTFKNFEIIVVDNHSTDNTKDVLLPLISEGKIRYIQHDRNYERGKSRNTGMTNATGKYLTLLDSDDFLYPQCLNDAYVFATENPLLELFQNKFELVNDQRKTVYKFEFPSLNNQYKALCDGNFISCIGTFLSENVYSQFRFSEDPKMVGSEDYEIWFRVLGAYKMGRINKINAGVRQHPTRSVENTNIYDFLDYQQTMINNTIKNDVNLLSKYQAYLNRFNAWFYLKKLLHIKKSKHILFEDNLLFKAIQTDTTIIFKLRFYKILFNILK